MEEKRKRRFFCCCLSGPSDHFTHAQQNPRSFRATKPRRKKKTWPLKRFDQMSGAPPKEADLAGKQLKKTTGPVVKNALPSAEDIAAEKAGK